MGTKRTNSLGATSSPSSCPGYESLEGSGTKRNTEVRIRFSLPVRLTFTRFSTNRFSDVYVKGSRTTSLHTRNSWTCKVRTSRFFSPLALYTQSSATLEDCSDEYQAESRCPSRSGSVGWSNSSMEKTDSASHCEPPGYKRGRTGASSPQNTPSESKRRSRKRSSRLPTTASPRGPGPSLPSLSRETRVTTNPNGSRLQSRRGVRQHN